MPATDTDPSRQSQSFFEDLYTKSRDPWGFESSSYELGRYDALMRALEPRRFRRAFEPGCSIGVLTERLAKLCDCVEAIDISHAAVERTRARCRDLPHVHASTGSLPQDLPSGSFDLIVLSEIGYYFRPEVLTDWSARLVELLEPNGILLAAHWLGTSPDHVLSGDRVHEILGGIPGLRREVSERHEGFRLDKWIRI